LIREVAAEHRADILELEFMSDHVHFLVEVDPQFGIHRLVKLLKGRSSRILRQEFPWLKSRLPTLWTNSYFVSTVGGAPLAVIKQYIENQKNVEPPREDAFVHVRDSASGDAAARKEIGRSF
jgi:putative transposase